MTLLPNRAAAIAALASLCCIPMLVSGCADRDSRGPGNAIQNPGSDPNAGLITEAGLVAVAAGDSSVRVDWRLPAAPAEAALFTADRREDVYTGGPLTFALSADHAIFTRLANGQPKYYGLGIRDDPSQSFRPVGPVLQATPGPVIEVEDTDGLREAIRQVANLGSANLWLAAGDYPVSRIELPPGACLYGGFDDTFELTRRSPLFGRTKLIGSEGVSMIEVRGEGDPDAPASILDGLVLDASARSFIGLDVNSSGLELRSVTVAGAATSGVRVRNSAAVATLPVRIANCVLVRNQRDGLQLMGALNVAIDGSRFDSNGQDGVEIDDLDASPDGSPVHLAIFGSRFTQNGGNGFRADLSSPEGLSEGRFVVRVLGSRFALNGGSGLVVDDDFRAAFSSDLEIADSLVRANGEHGILLDSDGTGRVLLRGLVVTANVMDGFQLKSAFKPGVGVVSTCYIAGNGGAGLHSTEGDKPILASQCVIAGNALGGVVSDSIPSSATSSILYLQPAPLAGSFAHSSPIVDAASLAADPVFVNAPLAFAVISDVRGGELELVSADRFPVTARVEVADDGVSRFVREVMGSTVSITADSYVVPVGSTVTRFRGNRESTLEDLRLVAGSPLGSMGFSSPGGTPVAAGLFASSRATAPGVKVNGVRDGRLFWASGTNPPIVKGVNRNSTIEVLFTLAIDPSSVAPGQVRVLTESGAEIDFGVTPVANRLVLTPAAVGGWGEEPFQIELHAGLKSIEGLAIAAPVVLDGLPE